MMRALSSLMVILWCLNAHALEMPSPPLANVTIETKDKPVSFTLEIAATPEDRGFGLMHRDSIGQFQGMLFLFPVAHDYEFWMANTYIPLDMLFINADEIVHIAHDVQPMTFRQHSAKQLVTSVIELPGGTARAENIHTGDKVSYIFSREVDIR